MSRNAARFLVIGGGCVVAAVLVVVSAVLRGGDLDAADKWASVIGVYLNIAALVVAVVGLVLGWHVGRTRNTAAGARQVITAEGSAVVKARGAQQASGSPAAGVDQRIAGRGKGTIDAPGAQVVRGDDGAKDPDG
ncbi:hypothetical protein AMES_6866 [Amycolatopsis mediterranei S699]|uniref:Uncharacterized protein n=2 Tax=Amycolatopsis mediterranei TaxID=33910 RepID=A0A0H3DEP3_AMYMU|nr:hypothetical protein [Amycolatopsis mediterranei]ADJ48692.1 hypothetical protein AMED_6973 [Amycolatopsis mediterranei U32]AEK45627.1 hypothetical protein RAM_35770 [Amycolatopsis mediterranei S699]AFO80401.1 hypothetical protein AMES_6866 [Amycolatopsis mediterranei S699]AGT87529.1 hypothetical protein B737_6866 [Amycolatopsis mediterranei RB]KDO03907.1 hypothetical protein DV26_45310 [Amycolatopsis mediterranei]